MWSRKRPLDVVRDVGDELVEVPAADRGVDAAQRLDLVLGHDAPGYPPAGTLAGSK
jgi:hypothetical protein